MPRAVMVRPRFFREYNLYRLECESGIPLRIIFGGLFCAANRDGTFEWSRRTALDAMAGEYDSFLPALDLLESVLFVRRIGPKTGVICDYQNHHCFGLIAQRPHPVSAATRRRIIERDGGKCRRCLSTENLQVDHITPVAAGGGNYPDNLQTLCATCNRKKGPAPYTMTPERWAGGPG